MLALKSADQIAEDLVQKIVSTRKKQKLTQAQLAKHSGVSLGSLRRFEQTGDINLKSLLQLLIVLGEANAFLQGLENSPAEFKSIQDVIRSQTKGANS